MVHSKSKHRETEASTLQKILEILDISLSKISGMNFILPSDISSFQNKFSSIPLYSSFHLSIPANNTSPQGNCSKRPLTIIFPKMTTKELLEQC